MWPRQVRRTSRKLREEPEWKFGIPKLSCKLSSMPDLDQSQSSQTVSHSSGLILSLSALFSGAALLISIFAQVSLALTLILLAICAISIFTLRWLQSTATERQIIKNKLSTGFIAGLWATIAYDTSRWLLVLVGQLDVSPFEAFNIFGQLIIGSQRPATITFVVGSTYHLLNGISFAIAYCFLLGGRNWKWGIMWALGLEAAMLAIYPGWLDLEALLAEFVAMSILGHIAYGSVLGTFSHHGLAEN